MQTCDEILELMSAALDGELNAGEQATLTAHLADCDACRSLYQELAGVHGAMKTLVVQAPEGFSGRVRVRLRAAGQGRRINWRGFAAAAAVFVVVAGAGVSMLPQWLAGQGARSTAPAAAAPTVSAPEAAPMPSAAQQTGEDELRLNRAAGVAEETGEAYGYGAAITGEAAAASDQRADVPKQSESSAETPDADPIWEWGDNEQQGAAPEAPMADTAAEPEPPSMMMRAFAVGLPEVQEESNGMHEPEEQEEFNMASMPKAQEESDVISISDIQDALAAPGQTDGIVMLALDLTPAQALEVLYQHISAGGDDMPAHENAGDVQPVYLMTGDGMPGDSVRFGNRVLEYRETSQQGGYYCFWYYRAGQTYGTGESGEINLLNRYAVSRESGTVVPEWFYKPEQTNNWDAYQAALRE